jgi:hypothetical protein
VSVADLDRSLNARQVADFRARSLVSLNRDIRENKFPPPDYTSGQYRFWKLSTVIRAREREIAESAAKAAKRRQAQLEAAARARAGRDRVREERDAAEHAAAPAPTEQILT